MEIAIRPLSLIIEITQAAGLDVAYEYDDLVFVSHNVFIFRFTDAGSLVDLYFNRDCEKKAEAVFMDKLNVAAKERGITLTRRGYFNLSQADGENMSLEFCEETTA